MNKPRTIEGHWWVQGDDKSPCFGVLTDDPELGLDLSAKVPHSGTIGDFMRLGRDDALSPVIHGNDGHDNPVTLFGCCRRQSSWSRGLSSYHIGSLCGLLNYRGSSWTEARFTVACVKYTLLHSWMNRHLVTEKFEQGVTSLKFCPDALLEFPLPKGVRLKIEGTETPNSSLTGYQIDLAHRVWFVFPAPQPVEIINRDYAHVFLRLLCLLTGERVFIEECAFFDCDPLVPGLKQPPQECQMLVKNKGIGSAERETHAVLMIASYDEIKSDFGFVLSRWFDRHEKLEPVLDLYFMVLANLVSTIQTRFLLLIQALEVYHARSGFFSSTELTTDAHRNRVNAIIDSAPPEHRDWLRDKLPHLNQKTLAQRISEILSSHGEQAVKLTNGIEDFAAKIRHSRNYYTHYSESLQKTGKVANNRELIRINLAIEDLLQICLLKELGITGRPIERIVRRHSDMTYVYLDSEPTKIAEASLTKGTT